MLYAEMNIYNLFLFLVLTMSKTNQIVIIRRGHFISLGPLREKGFFFNLFKDERIQTLHLITKSII